MKDHSKKEDETKDIELEEDVKELSEAKEPSDDLMTFKRFMRNPTKSTMPPMLNYVKQGIETKYARLTKSHGVFKYNLAKEGEDYLAHVVIPSETTPRLSYDVVIKFCKVPETEPRDLNGYLIKVFCNSPSFTFTYTYVYNEIGMYIDELKSKTEPIFLKVAPKEKNPLKVLGYDKFVYMAGLFLIKNDLLNRKLDKSEYVGAEDIYSVIVDTATKRKEAELRRKQKSDAERLVARKSKVRDKGTRTTSNTLPNAIAKKGRTGSSIGKVNKITPIKKKTGKKKLGK